jgi:hypothetical protein
MEQSVHLSALPASRSSRLALHPKLALGAVEGSAPYTGSFARREGERSPLAACELRLQPRDGLCARRHGVLAPASTQALAAGAAEVSGLPVPAGVRCVVRVPVRAVSYGGVASHSAGRRFGMPGQVRLRRECFEMGGVDARAAMAAVVNLCPGGKGTLCELICISVRQHGHSLAADRPVAVRALSAGPQPTGSLDADFGGER